MITLREHQKEGRDALLKNKKFCLFFGLGSGKTLTALGGLHELPPKRVLIVAPKRVLNGVWLVENRIDVSQHDITYMNYEKLARHKEITRQHFDVVILDEVHRIKGATTNIGKYMRIINNRAEYVWGLTGTPVANDYLDVYNIYNNMGIFEFYENKDDFLWKYYVTRPQQVQTKRGYQLSIRIPLYPREDNIHDLTTRIGKHCMVKRTEDCVDLPDSTTNLIYIEGMVSPTYKRFCKGIIETDEYEDTMTQLEAVNKKHQAANGFFYDKFGKTHIVCENKKLKELKDVLEDFLCETERVIVVYYYQHDLEELQTLPYTNTTDPKDFPNKQILFIQYGQSEGLNLQYCNNMIFYSYDYSFLNYDQMCGRVMRDGQKNNVLYTVLISRGTIEENIWHAIKNKESRDAYLKGVLTDERV